MSLERWTAWAGRWLRMAMPLALAAFAGSAAAAADFLRASAPDWVTWLPVDGDAVPVSGQPNKGVHWLLIDQQTQVDKAGKVTFRRIVSKALNERGVAAVAHFSIDFDPSYQSLALNTLKVHRQGHAQDRLGSAQIRVLQRETELEYRVYDGSKSVDVVLEDIRAGDTVEYAYTVSGSNPVFGGLEFGRMDMQWHVPVHLVHRRLRVAAGRHVHLAQHLSKIEPAVTRTAQWTEYTWRAIDVPAVAQQEGVPDWYDPYGNVQWSEFAGWGGVARWAEPLYRGPRIVSRDLKAEIERIAAASPTAEGRLREVLSFVQSQIRYLGIEMGPGSHAPRAPELVLAKRYGDCKDKVLLAVTMLRALGITAHPALVDTDSRQVVAEQLPSPGAFNHVILRAQLDGRELWLDPTRSPQKGSLENIAQADFGRALVLDGQSTDLSAMPPPASAQDRREVLLRIDASAGFGEPAPMKVRTTYEGASADQMRQTLRSEGHEDLQRSYLNYYLRSYPGLTLQGPLSVEDDETANRLVTVEHYSTPSLWAKNPPNGKPVVYLYAPDIRSVLRRPDETVRMAPLALDFPQDLTVKVTVLLPAERSIVADRQSIRSKAFEFDSATAYENSTLQLSYHYRALADHVDPQDLAKHAADLDLARAKVGYTLWKEGGRRAPVQGVAWLALAAGLALAGVVVGMLWSAWYITHGDPIEVGAQSTVTTRRAWLIGAVLLFGPLAVAAAAAAMVGGLTGRLDMIDFGTVLIAVFAWAMWNVYWHPRWWKWALSSVRDREAFRSFARRRGLSLESSALPAAPAMPTDGQAG
jgi:transglutaminase-like putative cysteine protease